jgi:hypothetical protein
MPDDDLIALIESDDAWRQSDWAQTLRQYGITTPTALFAVLRDPSAGDDLRGAACGMISAAGQRVDARRAAPALIAALNATSESLHVGAIFALSAINSRRAYNRILQLVTDKTQSAHVRASAINMHPLFHEERALPALRAIMFDVTDAVLVRAMAVEWSAPLPVEDYIALLANPVPDMRFWAAFRLASIRFDADLLPALEAVDRIAAFDHTLPGDWGWHVDREALAALEIIRYAAYRGGNPDDGPRMYLISPADEYDRFLKSQRDPSAEPREITLNVAPEWLRAALEQAWPGIRFEVARSAPQTYVLEWEITTAGRVLIGGLHRNRYAVVLMGYSEDVHLFALWYRDLLPDERLVLYPWADEGADLEPGVTPETLRDVLENWLYLPPTS